MQCVTCSCTPLQQRIYFTQRAGLGNYQICFFFCFFLLLFTFFFFFFEITKETIHDEVFCYYYYSCCSLLVVLDWCYILWCLITYVTKPPKKTCNKIDQESQIVLKDEEIYMEEEEETAWSINKWSQAVIKSRKNATVLKGLVFYRMCLDFTCLCMLILDNSRP